MKNFLFILLWMITLAIVSFYTYEHPEKIETIKSFFYESRQPEIKYEITESKKILANSFNVEFSKIISLEEKTAFIVHDEGISKFDERDLKIYTQNGYIIKNHVTKKLNLPKEFTTERNGGIKTVFIYKNNEFALISSSKKNCFYASIVSLNNSKEIFKSKCLNDTKKNTDFNGLGSSNIHFEKEIFLTIGAPEQGSSKIRTLAQDQESVFGKIVAISKIDLDKVILREKNNLDLKVFTSGHRNPQGLTKINNSIFSVEHGPLGGDELNKIVEDKNYGWPIVSYGTRYLYDQKGKFFDISHENKKFEEPIFALIPSVGISGLNICPSKLREYYKKPCLMALSLYGNNLRPGRSLIIYLLNEKMDKIHSLEKIYIGNGLLFRHFVTNSKNELYEDSVGNIYVSADKRGIYKISFVDFRK